MKINNFGGKLSDISARKEALLVIKYFRCISIRRMGRLPKCAKSDALEGQHNKIHGMQVLAEARSLISPLSADLTRYVQANELTRHRALERAVLNPATTGAQNQGKPKVVSTPGQINMQAYPPGDRSASNEAVNRMLCVSNSIKSTAQARSAPSFTRGAYANSAHVARVFSKDLGPSRYAWPSPAFAASSSSGLPTRPLQRFYSHLRSSGTLPFTRGVQTYMRNVDASLTQAAKLNEREREMMDCAVREGDDGHCFVPIPSEYLNKVSDGGLSTHNNPATQPHSSAPGQSHRAENLAERGRRQTASNTPDIASASKITHKLSIGRNGKLQCPLRFDGTASKSSDGQSDPRLKGSILCDLGSQARHERQACRDGSTKRDGLQASTTGRRGGHATERHRSKAKRRRSREHSLAQAAFGKVRSSRCSQRSVWHDQNNANVLASDDGKRVASWLSNVSENKRRLRSSSVRQPKLPSVYICWVYIRTCYYVGRITAQKSQG